MQKEQNYKAIFTFTELAEYLGITRQAVSSYKKNNPKRFKLILLGYACKRLDIDYDDLKELNKLKGYIVTDNKRNGYRYFYRLQDLADFLEVALSTIKTAYKENEASIKRDELIRLGFAAYKLNIDFDDLLEFKNYKQSKAELSKRLNK